MENEITIQVANKNGLRIFTYFLSTKPPVCMLWIQLHATYINISNRLLGLVESEPVQQASRTVILPFTKYGCDEERLLKFYYIILD